MSEDKSRKNPASSQEPEFDYLMVGAGLFNAVLSAQFVAMGRKVLVVERRSEIGGNCHTYEKDGITVHKNSGENIGALSTDSRFDMIFCSKLVEPRAAALVLYKIG